MKNVEKQINTFEKKIKEQYPDLHIGYTYDAKEDYYYIWHINSSLQYEDVDFLVFVGNLIKEYFYSKDIFNFSFGYDYLEDEKSKSTYEVKPNLIDFIIKPANLFEFHDISYYKLNKHFYSLDLVNFDNINVSFDVKNLSFCHPIMQTQLTRETHDECENTPEKALAA